MKYIQNLMKHKQTIKMALSLILIIGFFLPWFTSNPDLDMFATSNSSFSGFNIVQGIHVSAPIISSFGDAYGIPLASKLIYLGYLLWLIPLLGLTAIVLSGIRNKRAEMMHLIQFGFTLFILMLILILINLNADMRELFSSLMRIGFALPLSMVVATFGIAIQFIKTDVK